MRARIRLAAVAVVLATLAAPAADSAVSSSSPSYLMSGFACIHRYEGAWSANTGNGYYGGLQMDWSFMQAYGAEYLHAWGTADKWPPTVQVASGIKAYLSGRGWAPWPNTARKCGLI